MDLMTKDTYAPDQLKRLVGERPVYIWGARHDGYGMCKIFERHGIKVGGFIDSSETLRGTSVFGYSVEMPEAFFGQNPKGSFFIVIAAPFFIDEISDMCQEKGLATPDDYMGFDQIQRFDYQVDVSGICNLHCISCPRGNYPKQPKGGFMSPEIYRQVVEKITHEDPFTGIITLYNWGEPLLHPQLPEIINITHEYGMLSAVSSNLCVKNDFTEVIKSKPTWFRISLSGWGENYEITHTGGSWDLLYRNMFRLRELRDLYHPEMIIEVFFHIYKHNNGEDFYKIKALCDELGFTLRYRHAALAPLENIEAVVDGKPLTKAAEKTRKYQILPVEEAMEIARNQIERPCFFKRFLWIAWDLRVAQCMEWYAPDCSLVEKNYLDTSMHEIVAARSNNAFCERCMQKAIHRCYCVYGDEKLIGQRQSIPGQCAA